MQARNRVFGAVVYGSARPERRYAPQDLAVAEELARRAVLALENARLYREAQAAIQQREEFLSIAAHELKTPLAALQILLQTLLRQLDKPDVDVSVLRERARSGEEQGKRLARLVSELLDVSSIQAGRTHLEREDIDLAEAIHSVVARHHDEIAARGIDVAVHAPTPILGTWDRLRIELVITNLLTNAIKYGEGRLVGISLEADGPSALLSVEDQGIGMSPELINRLFKPFERGVSPGTYGGLGLGLYIADQIVRAHGGAIHVESTPGKGSNFTVRLPRNPTS
jgi:signal transduction histidine kinase